MDKFAIIIGNFNISLLILDRTTRKISKDIEDVNSTINQLGQIDVDRTFYPTIAEHTFFSNYHRIFTKMTIFCNISLDKLETFKYYSILLHRRKIRKHVELNDNENI